MIRTISTELVVHETFQCYVSKNRKQVIDVLIVQENVPNSTRIVTKKYIVKNCAAGGL